jgi:hypothetical protein
VSKFWEKYKLTFHLLAHPFDGFYAMKYEKRGSMLVAAVNFLLMWVSLSFRNQYASVVVNTGWPLAYNSLIDGGSLLLILVLWSAANWSVTSLTDGEGKFKEIIMANCYAMTPLILTFIPATLLSNLLALEESAFYFLIIIVAVVWFLLLAYVGMVTVHNFTAGKALATLFLTLLALLVIVFLIALLFTLYQQLYTFVYSIYIELVYRQ